MPLRAHVSLSADHHRSNPRKTMPRAFRTILYRLVAFFCIGALCVGIVVPYNDPE